MQPTEDRRIEQRRQDELTPIREQRSGDDRRGAAVREPRWLTWTRANQARGKSLDRSAA